MVLVFVSFLTLKKRTFEIIIFLASVVYKTFQPTHSPAIFNRKMHLHKEIDYNDAVNFYNIHYLH